MKTPTFFLFALLIASAFYMNKVNAKSNMPNTNSTLALHVDNNTPLKYNGVFAESENYDRFRLYDYDLLFDNDKQEYIVNKSNKQMGTIAVHQYDGPGIDVFLFGDATDAYQVIVLEALADNGTAWYSVALLGKDKVLNQRFINNPRANSDSCHIKDFMKIAIVNDCCEIRMEKKNIAGYSYIPKDLKVDSTSVYITMPILENKQGQTNADSLFLFEYSNDTIRQRLQFRFLGDSKIEFKLTSENRVRNNTVVMQGITVNEYKDFGADKTGSLYPQRMVQRDSGVAGVYGN